MNNPLDTTLFDRAASFAIAAHSGTERRGKGFPYIIHPMEAASIVSSITNDEELLAAAILHDTVEDTGATADQIRGLFGDRVAELVMYETALKRPGMTWCEKREMQIDKLRSAPRDAKIVAIGDKLSNLRAIVRDYRAMGDELWLRFKAPDGRIDIVWYYHGLAEAFAELADTEPYREFVSLLRLDFMN